MPNTKVIDLQFPARGVVRRLGLRSQVDRRVESYPTPWATNVRLLESMTFRLRGGSFAAPASQSKDPPIYRDRAITFSANKITAARQGDSSDTTMSSDISDVQRPILFQLAEADDVGGTVVAVIPHKDSHLLCFTSGQSWVLSGDPATGQLSRISDQCGIVGASAWCIDHDTIYFLSPQGLYSVSADGSGLTALSEDVVPEELTGVTDANTVLDFNHADEGVYIHIPTADVSWFYDTDRKGFWPFDRGTTDSHVLCGPFRLGRLNQHGRVLNIQGTLAAGSANVTWRLVPGRTAEEAAANGKLAIEASIAATSFAAYIHSEGVWTAGRSHMSYPRARAVFCCLWLHSAGEWAWEGASLDVILSGMWR